MTPEEKIARIKELMANKAVDSEIIKELKALREELKEYSNLRNVFKYDNVTVEKIEASMPDKMNIDWENQPVHKQTEPLKIDFSDMPVPVIKTEKTDMSLVTKGVKAIETIVSTIGKTIISGLNRLIFLNEEPETMLISKNEITEIYKDKTVTYKLYYGNDGSLIKSVRTEN